VFPDDFFDPADRDLRERWHAVRQPQRVRYRVAYLPEAEYAAAWAQKLLDASMYRRHEDYRRELQDTLVALSNRSGASVSVVPLDVAGLLAYAAREGKDPSSRQTRLDYSNSLDEDHDIAWPPQRNAPCWCGSDRKYKKCCGAPGFLQVQVPDPASLILKITLDDVEPAVWRRVAVPSNTPLDQVHEFFQTAMGWRNQHVYAFDNDEHIIIDPRSSSPAIKADSERLIAIATEPGEHFHYLYDFGDSWSHTVTLEEIREGGEHNVVRVLDGAGACPPEDCGGADGYLALLHALADPTDPLHAEAIDWLGEGWDATAYHPR
jgi:hypothetical protein